MAKIIMDASYGGRATGEIYQRRLEKDDTLRLALAIGEALMKQGIDVVYTRTTDTYLTPRQRTDFINREGGDLMVSIKRITGDAIPQTPTINFYTNSYTCPGNLVAANIARQLEELSFQNQGVIVRTDLSVLRDINMPGLVIGLGHIRSDRDNALIDERFDEIVAAVTQGIIDSFDFIEQGTTLEEDTSLDQDSSLEMYQGFMDMNFYEFNQEVPLEEEEEIGEPFTYRVQVGLFRVYENALNVLNRLTMQGYQAQIVDQGDFYSVQVGDFPTLDEAAELERNLRILGYNTLLIAI